MTASIAPFPSSAGSSRQAQRPSILSVDDSSVEEVVERAAALACVALDEFFPGAEKGGITSNFQGALVRALKQMLEGKGSAYLPQLVVDDRFFGNPCASGSAYLIVRTMRDNCAWNEAAQRFGMDVVQALDLEFGHSGFRPLSQVSDAYTSFEAAAADALRYLQANGYTLAEARELALEVRAVEFDKASTTDSGYVLAQ